MGELTSGVVVSSDVVGGDVVVVHRHSPFSY